MLPNFLCIGAQKCGTTTIWRILDSHPDIFMARPRETRFFYDDFQYFGGIHTYEITYFAPWSGQAAAGEKCPEYLYDPRVAQRIRTCLGPSVKFIVSLRNPALRAFSHYRHNLAMLRESRSFDEVIEREADDLAASGWPPIPFGYLARGLYARQLQPYLDLFPRENFLFVSFEREVIGDQQKLADRIHDFLGVQRLRLTNLPFREGRPPLDDLIVRSRPAAKSNEIPPVDIERRTLFGKGFRSLLSAWWRGRRIAGNIRTTRIRKPSPALAAFAAEFSRNRPDDSTLPPERALAMNRRHFEDDIRRLSSILPAGAMEDWLRQDSVARAENAP